ncbi:2OG-Fe(II) oxygenase [Elizabethkingia meningoseptica]|uniref:2OG-Fe(II) oxygenase n=1 Tax=Elizabethkingia meningoseptica TaxID=238 RepID=UPI0023B1834C|nr:2OG-Fe(II) oxygenase [Elizabethkingia meningoseptica]MDE5436972.1 2OG-Fe(II) oxygenase [Elizabethkingia meningoseptica]MDE5509001.1 2OG-Fe(II) oxygenase [Elizabethkingia meningoseptica]MDE5514518.1 2OG-Fe(II) oxygenase [Elizabethkingia meningoseptica]MDE5525164.1 2OG-Fe(II) oxygenase [Elizabethkingia meningoseptica]MDE5528729.1 2OG-Fe(II) oxygenase [Elizabethkingia meningoseptica]
MTDLIQKIENTDWGNIAEEMHQHGYAVIPRFLSHQECENLKNHYDQPGAYRKKVIMERYRFGAGEYKYFNYPLPDIIQNIRTHVYSYLAPIANTWFKALNIDKQFPSTHQELLAECHSVNQEKATPLILKYGKGGFNTLHQDLYGDIYFPIQMVLMLSQPGEDFSGGEFVLTQQIPRAQSKAIVLTPQKGDIIIFTTNFKPEKGSKGYYRVNMKHGVSEVKSGSRFTLGIIFHDALN